MKNKLQATTGYYGDTRIVYSADKEKTGLQTRKDLLMASAFYEKAMVRAVNRGGFEKELSDKVDQSKDKSINAVIKIRESDRISSMGGRMEHNAESLKMVNEEVLQSKEIMQNLFNEIIEINNQTMPRLAKGLEELRGIRMAVERESKLTLTMLKDIRTFFLERDYQTEIARLNEFVDLCSKLKKLKDDGTLDVISDTIIKLQIGGKQ